MKLLLILLALPFSAIAADNYQLSNMEVYDGDTIKADVTIWPNLIQRISIRINGIDTAELRTKNKCEKALGYKAKQALIDFIGDRKVTVSNVRLGKYAGRVLASISVGGEDAAYYMIKAGYARRYAGGKRPGWCDR